MLLLFMGRVECASNRVACPLFSPHIFFALHVHFNRPFFVLFFPYLFHLPLIARGGVEREEGEEEEETRENASAMRRQKVFVCSIGRRPDKEK